MPSIPPRRKRHVSLDTETTGVDLHHGAKPFLVSTCDEDGANRFWEWDVDPVTREPAVVEEDLEQIREVMRRADVLVFQNPKFDAAALSCVTIEVPWEKVVDTLLGGHLLASNHAHDLTSMIKEHLGEDIQHLEDAAERVVKWCRAYVKRELPHWKIAGEGVLDMPSVKAGGRDEDKPWKNDMWLPRALASHWAEVGEVPDGVDVEELLTVTSAYANGDTSGTLFLWLYMEREIRDRGLWAIYESRLVLPDIAFRMEDRGVTVSGVALEELTEEYGVEVALAADECVAIAARFGHDLELPAGASPNDSIREFFYGSNREVCPACLAEKKVKVWAGQVPSSGSCPKCAARGIESRLRLESNACLGLEPVLNQVTLQPTLDKGAMEHYESTLPPGDALDFIRLLKGKRSRDTALSYMEGYRRFWLPTEHLNWFKLHPSLNPTGTDTLRWSSNNPNCVDGETEFLTTEGWVRADELREDHIVAQYWKHNKQIDFVKPSRVVAQHHKGLMYHITTTQQIDLMVTPNHRCLLQDRKGNFSDKTPDKFGNDYHHFNAGVYHGGDVSFTADEVTWLCAVQADGSYCESTGKGYGIVFAFKKERKVERLRDCMKRLGVKFTEKNNEVSGVTSFYVGTHEPVVVFAKAMMPDKCFDNWLLECDRNTLDMFLEELFNWDGDYTREAAWTSSDKKSADWVQILWSLSGSRAYMATRMPNNGWAVRDHHYVNIVKGRDYSLTSNYAREAIDWDGLVYCVTVPSSYIVVRRNGKVSVTGNSQNISKKESFNLRRCFGPAPGREWWSMDAKNLELRIPAYEAGETDLMHVFDHPDDPPYYGSYHLVVFDALHPALFAEHGKACKDMFESTWYQWTKNGNFAVIYGCQRRKADETYHVAGAYDKVRDRFPKIAHLSDLQKKLAERRGYVETIPDRSVDPRRGYPILASRLDDGRVSPTTPLNYHVSGTAMWWTCRAMTKCDEQLRAWSRGGWDGFLTMQVHDELVFDCPRGVGPRPWETNLSRMLELKRRMESCGADIGVPTPVSVEYHSETWATGKVM